MISVFVEDLASAFTELDSFETASVFFCVSEFVAFPTSSNVSVFSCLLTLDFDSFVFTFESFVDLATVETTGLEALLC